MGKLKFIEAGAIEIDYEISGPPLLPCCVKALAVFQHNLKNAIKLAAVPGWVSLTTCQWIEAKAGARTEEDRHKNMASIVDVDNLQLSELLEKHTRITESLADSCGGEIEDMFRTLLSSLCAQVYSATEQFFSETVTNAIAEYPSYFNDPAKLKKGKYQSLRFIRQSYGEAFDNCPKIDAVLLDDRIRGLAQIRHAFTHSFGRVDQTFCDHRDGAGKSIGSSSPLLLKWFPSAQVDKPLHLNGMIVCEAVDGSVKACSQLLTEVNAWLIGKGNAPNSTNP